MKLDKNIDHILFDFDGTIADTLPLSFELYNEVAEQYNFISADNSELPRLMSMTISEILKLKNIPLYMVPIALLNAKKKMKQRIAEVKPFKGIKEFLNDLKKAGYHISIISSNSKENMLKFFKLNDIDVFDYIYSSTTLFGKDKLVKHYLKAVKTTPDKVVYVGDEIRDIECARNSNIPIVAVTWGFNNRNLIEEHKPNFIVDTIDELESILIPS
jgi:phosphoglycolate phosphatase